MHKLFTDTSLAFQIFLWESQITIRWTGLLDSLYSIFSYTATVLLQLPGT